MEGEGTFCCQGCALAYRIIHDAGGAAYYRRRTALPPRPSPRRSAWSGEPPRIRADGRREVRLAIDGLRCASCVWVLERVLAAQPGVVDAWVSYGSGHARLVWDPETTTLERIAHTIESLGYQPGVPGPMLRADGSLLARLGVAVFAAMNVMMLAVALYLGWGGGMADRFHALFGWSALILATPVALWCAQPFYAAAWAGLRHGVLAMDVPIALAVGGLYVHALVATPLGVESYADSLTMLVALLLLGRVLEARGRRRAAEAASLLAASAPRTAFRPDGRRIPVSEVRVGDLVRVTSGAEIAVDGIVTEGTGLVDAALVTGEAEPTAVREGDGVTAGTVLRSGGLLVRVTATGADTVLARMADHLTRALDATGRDPTNRLAPWFTALTLLVAGAALMGWGTAVGWGKGIETAVAVLVVACPCALVLARPLTAAAALHAAAGRGLLFRSGDALLALARVRLVFLDKTGTLTRGRPTVVRAEEGALRIATALERESDHPVARALRAEAERRGIPVPMAADLKELPGGGVEGMVRGLPARIQPRDDARLGVWWGGMELEPIALRDVVRSGAGAVLQALHRQGLETILVTGDHPDRADALAGTVGVGRVLARQSPEGKADLVRAAQRRGDHVLFLGDGANDGPALAAANVGLAVAGGAASSVLVAHGTVLGDSLAGLPEVVSMARRATRQAGVTQAASLSYNVVTVGAAVAGWVNPLVAAVLMPLSSLAVIGSALRFAGEPVRATRGTEIGAVAS